VVAAAGGAEVVSLGGDFVSILLSAKPLLASRFFKYPLIFLFFFPFFFFSCLYFFLFSFFLFFLLFFYSFILLSFFFLLFSFLFFFFPFFFFSFYKWFYDLIYIPCSTAAKKATYIPRRDIERVRIIKCTNK
jgi:hypothetical protein